jgi:hypothetical protein
MASIISAGTTDSTSLNVSSDRTGILQLASNNAVTAVTIDGSQNVGIGTASPTEKLDVQSSGDLKARIYTTGTTVSTHSGLTLKTGSYEYLIQNFTSTAGSAGALRFYDITAGSERMRIDSAGNVGIGVTPQTWSSSFKPALQFGTTGSLLNGSGYTFLSNNWYQDATGTDKYITTNFATNYYQYNGTHVWRSASSGTAGNSISWTTVMNTDVAGRVWIGNTASSGNTFRVYAVGSDNSVAFGTAGAGVYLPNGATSFSTYSDIRLKNITGRYETPLADIAKLDAIKFTWKNDSTNKPCVGVSAQSVQTAVPEAIDHSTTFNTEGDTTEYLTVRYAELVPLMIASIQELKAINDTLIARIEALENK